MGRRGLSNQYAIADWKKARDCLRCVCLKGPKRLLGWRRGSCDNVGNIQPVQIDAFPGHSNFLIGSNKYRTAKPFSQIKGLNGQGKAVIHIYRC